MGWEAIFCLAVLALVLVGLIINVSPDALLLGAAVLVTIVGIISPQEALAGFSNQAVLTAGALYVVAVALRQTGALNRASSWVLGKAKSEGQALLRMAGILPGMSTLLNNTPSVAVFIPIVSDWCRKYRVAASRLLIPLSYLCILGGTCTLIGTSTNLVVNGSSVAVSKCTTLAGAKILASRSKVKRGEWQRFENAPFTIVPCGSVAYKLAQVSAGLADATFTLVSKNEWDVATGALLVEAAGGKVIDKQGRPLSFNRKDNLSAGIIASSQQLSGQISRFLHSIEQGGK